MCESLGMAGGKASGAAWLGACGVFFAPTAALGSAWAPPEGGILITTSAEGVRENQAFSDTSLYLEAPMTGKTSIVVAPKLELGRTLAPDDPSVSRNTWRGEATVSAKALLHQGRRGALSVQAGPVLAGGRDDICARFGVEARALAGASLGGVFAEAQGAYRHLSGGCGNSKLDLTLGWRPAKRWLGMTQTFVDHQRAGAPIVNVQTSLVRFTKKGAGLQLGARFRIDRAGRDEGALVIGWWSAPRAP